MCCVCSSGLFQLLGKIPFLVASPWRREIPEDVHHRRVGARSHLEFSVSFISVSREVSRSCQRVFLSDATSESGFQSC